ncbi:hypothetical protein [Roseateles sp.]|uniref:hypothetical protein n=1 Tax=Roseateles sp. TaxID=1971397 RepID=UPI002DFCDB36|nr:hypothetical protein [Roseateles sp.]
MGCCTGSTFTPAPDAALDPLRRVNYSFGMVLGVDDFRQEHAYLAARDERALRETIGYGVITGLGVAAPKPASASEGQQVRVAPGLALMPDGHLVAVAAEQCANLQAWLDAEKARDATTASRPTVYVLLRFAEASGSPVPIPGEPCRDESELSADARVVDGFALDFAWTPPDASEDLALRAVVAWIRGIKVRPTAPAGQTLASFQRQVEAGLKEAITAAWGDPHAPTPPMPAAATPPLPLPSHVSLPAPPTELQIPRAEVAAYYAAAFEVWTRLLRSGFMAHHGPVPGAEPLAERALLLAAVDAKAGADGTRAVRMLGRPQLLHLRLLQEWLLRDGSQDAPREAHYVLGKGDPELDHAQDLLADFAAADHAMTRIDLVPDTTDGGSGNKARIVPAVKWPGGGPGGGPDYYGPGMSQPIPVADGGTGQAVAPATGALLVGRAASGTAPARFELGGLAGAPLPKPAAPSPNILVDATGAAPTIRLDTVQDIGTDASPSFASLDLSGDLGVAGGLSVDGEVVLGQPLNRLLATDEQGVVVAARPWDGDEGALDAGKPPPYAYQPNQPAPVRIEDGGTGLQQRPRQLQVLVGLEPRIDSLRSQGGDYVLATLTPGANTDITLTQGEGRDWQLVVEAGGGAATQVVAAGDASAPPSLTAVANGNVVTIDTVQPLHTAASPRFSALSLSRPPRSEAPDAMVGWRKQDGQLVLTQPPPAADVGVQPIRYIGRAEELKLVNDDHVVVVAAMPLTRLVQLALPEPKAGGFDEGRVITVKALGGLAVSGVEGDKRIGLEAGNSVTLIASVRMGQWLVIGRS